MLYPKRKIAESLMYLGLLGIAIHIYITVRNNAEVLKWQDSPMVLYWPYQDTNINCYETVDNDALISVQDPSFSPKINSIFFHETSCRGGLDSRQACAVESAARAHPDWEVYLLFNAPVSDAMVKNSCLVKLLQYPNVKLARIHAQNFSSNTILRDVVSKRLRRSVHPVEHSADIMKMLTLNRWGGVSLDLDVIVLRSFNDLPMNWIAKENDFDLATGVMRFSKDEAGRNLTAEILRELASTYREEGWSSNGPKAIQRVLKRRCDVIRTIGECQGITIFGSELFYPVRFSGVHLLSKKGPLTEVVGNPYTFHIWNLLTKIYSVSPESAYVDMASKLCPTIYETFGEAFGI